jgi:anti-sigma B factor antagonist
VSNIALLTTNVHDHDAVTVLTVTGEVDLFTYPALQNSLTEVLETQPAALVLDLRAVTFYDPVGLDAIVDAYDVVSLSGDFAVVADDPELDRAFRSMGLCHGFVVHPTLHEAIAGVRRN